MEGNNNVTRKIYELTNQICLESQQDDPVVQKSDILSKFKQIFKEHLSVATNEAYFGVIDEKKMTEVTDNNEEFENAMLNIVITRKKYSKACDQSLEKQVLMENKTVKAISVDQKMDNSEPENSSVEKCRFVDEVKFTAKKIAECSKKVSMDTMTLGQKAEEVIGAFSIVNSDS